MADIAEALHRSNGLLSIAKMSQLSGVARTEICKICAAAKAKTTRRAGRQNADIDQQLARTGAQRRLSTGRREALPCPSGRCRCQPLIRFSAIRGPEHGMERTLKFAAQMTGAQVPEGESLPILMRTSDFRPTLR